MNAYLVASMHEYLVRLEVFIFVWVSVYRILWCASSEWPGETVYLPGLLWVIDDSIRDLFVLLIGMYFKYMRFNLPWLFFFIIVRNQSIFYTYNMYSKKIRKTYKMYMKI